MQNIEQIIKQHNIKNERTTATANARTCNCTTAPCPLDGQCLAENIVYMATVTVHEREHEEVRRESQPPNRRYNLRRTTSVNTDNENADNSHVENRNMTTHTYNEVVKKQKVYIGASEKFKERYRNHTKSFRHRQYETDSELSKYIWYLKNSNLDFDIKWKIMQRTAGYNKSSKSCSLCLAEKFQICTYKQKNALLNKRNELVSKCRHQNKHLLKNFY